MKPGFSAKDVRAYRDGCELGRAAALHWITNPNRGNPIYGGTLQHVILDFAQRLRAAGSERAEHGVKGEIVGFCLSLEMPEEAAQRAFKPAGAKA